MESKLTEVDSLKRELAVIRQLLVKQATGAETPTAYLWQNEPNPTDGSTIIRYSIPQEATSAQLKLFSSTGRQLQTIDLPAKGLGQFTLKSYSLPAGTYPYHLVVDGQSVASKKLVLTR